jgi:predicted transcriptional regulator
MKRPIKARTLALVSTCHDGLTASTAAILLGASWATASCTLARLYWAGAIDRVRDGRAYVYTPRPLKVADAAA